MSGKNEKGKGADLADTKIHEINYSDKLDEKGKKWLLTKPFGNYNRDESRRAFRDFSTVLFLIEKYCPDAKKIVELGCGPGWLSIFLRKMDYVVSGYDISPSMIQTASARAKQEGVEIEFKTADIEDEKIEKEVGQSDVVLIYDSLHHCQADEKVLKNCFDYLRPGGILILAEPNLIHGKDPNARSATAKYGVTERGMSYKKLANICHNLGFGWTKRYHASGQAFLPRNEDFANTVKMLFFPLLTRFYFGRKKARVWLAAGK